jgi:GxxExxY protein
MEINDVTHKVIGAAIEVHRHLGPGLLESAYQTCLQRELGLQGLNFETEVAVPIEYKGEVIMEAYRLDMLVENEVVVELKAVESLNDKHKAQLLTYLQLMRKRAGLLINFNEAVLKHGIKRIVNKY